MKLEKLDHKHALTSWLKVILFALLMLAPMFSIATRCLYVVCNKNAKDSYSGQSETELTYFNELPPLNETIYSYLNYNTEFYNTGYLPVSNFEYIGTNETQISNPSDVAYIRYYNSKQLYLWDSNYSNLKSYNLSGSTYVNFKFKLLAYNDTINDVGTMFAYVNNNSYNYVDNVFDYSISQIANSQYYNWTQNTAIYTGVEAMTTGIGINGATIPILLTYWFLLTVIYIVIDIVINLFTYITHFLNKKTN